MLFLQKYNFQVGFNELIFVRVKISLLPLIQTESFVSLIVQSLLLQVPKLAGVEYSPADQLRKLDALRAQLTLKKQLLIKLKSKATVDGSN